MTQPEVPQQRVSAAKKAQIQAALQSRIRSGCPRCGSGSGVLEDGYTYRVLQNGDPSLGVNAPGPVIVSAVVTCATCGFLSEYALAPLGINPWP